MVRRGLVVVVCLDKAWQARHVTVRRGLSRYGALWNGMAGRVWSGCFWSGQRPNQEKRFKQENQSWFICS